MRWLSSKYCDSFSTFISTGLFIFRNFYVFAYLLHTRKEYHNKNSFLAIPSSPQGHITILCVCVCVCVCMHLHILYLSQYFNKIAILCYEIIWNKVNNQILTSWGKFSQDVSWNVTGCISACFMFVYLFGGKRQHKEY